ncbi:tubulin alpha-1 chain [Reticulomyxa filosa]|uniref:Tubulin alpha chain n=1 Tax=Reticulomyxa filosa TaxID=46433 RepID=X6NU89_RETFI|nr:tubulin alpha-1 chain [Reticulomyxa filosa]|eukprot:ETO29488.1 tubulin alpha-1 chain [Reticulomyxa filosa]
MFASEFLFCGKEDSGNNFARGYNSTGRLMIEQVSDGIRKQVDKCENLDGFVIPHSVAGGTGSGIGALLLEQLARDYKKKIKVGLDIYPSAHLSTCVMEAYNTMLATSGLIENTDISLVLDNEAIYKVCKTHLGIPSPKESNLNRLIAKVTSSFTSFLRFANNSEVSLQDMHTYLVPFPRLHFIATGMAPILSLTKKESVIVEEVTTTSGSGFRAAATLPNHNEENKSNENNNNNNNNNGNDVLQITEECINPRQWFVEYKQFDPIKDIYMSIYLNYRGEVKSKEANSAIMSIKEHKKATLVGWSPACFKIGLCNVPAATLPDDDVAPASKTVTMIANNAGMHRMLVKRICLPFDLMYSLRSFVHWYVYEALEESELFSARENMGFLERDYSDVVTEYPFDDDNDELEEFNHNYF